MLNHWLIRSVSRPIMKRLEDFADSPLVPALLAQIHADSDRELMNVSYCKMISRRL
jgi:hypothetical protein